MSKQFQRKLRLAEAHLQAVCPRMRDCIDRHGSCELQPVWDREPMEALVRAIAHQQLHGKAAESILKRLLDRFPKTTFPTDLQLVRMRTTTYRTCGFSLAKTEAIRGIARASIAQTIPTRIQAEQMTDEAIIESLIALRGVGRWTVEMLLIFTLGRMDVMPTDDYGVRAGLKQLYQLPEMPRKQQFAEWTDAWSPYRSIGAWYLWRVADEQKAKPVQAMTTKSRPT